MNFGGVQTITQGTAANVTMTEPAGISAGEKKYSFLYIESSTAVTPPASYTIVLADRTNLSGQSFAIYLAEREHQAGDPSSITWNFASAFRDGGVFYVTGNTRRTSAVVSGAITSKNSSTGSTYPDVSIPAPDQNNCLIVWIGFQFNAATASAPPTGFTEQLDAAGHDFAIATKQQTTAAAETATAAAYTGVAGNSMAMLLSLRSLVFEQEGARWRNDDGNESGATWAGAQDANVTAPLGTVLRPRIIVNATGDPVAQAYQLEYRVNSGAWKRARPMP